MSQSMKLELDARELSDSTVNVIRILLGVSGLLALAVGAFLTFSPEKSTAVAAILFGLYFTVAGFVRIGAGLFARESNGSWRVLNILFGTLVLVAGVMILRQPEIGVVALGIFVGLGWIIDGIAAIAGASNRGSARGVGILMGLLSVVAGIVVLLIPAAALELLFIVSGVFLMVLGVLGVIAAFAFGKGKKA